METPGAIRGNYQYVSRDNQKPEPWKRFFVRLAGTTDGAHLEIIRMLKGAKQREVSSLEESHYVAVFCSVTSRVGSDVSEALENIPDGKPVILMMMHHNPSRDLNQIIAETRRQVMNPNIYLTVDFEFHNGKFPRSNHNRGAMLQVVGLIAQSFPSYSKKRTLIIFFAVLAIVIVTMVVIMTSILV